MAKSSERFTFPGSQGLDLAARLDIPAGKIKAYALFAHCFTCTKDIFAASRIAEGLNDAGIAVLRFDFTGLGASEGEFANTNFSSNVADLVAAADHMRKELDAPKIVIGHSLGGAAVLAASHNIPEAKAVATVGAPSDPGHVAHHFQDAIADIERDGEAEVKLVGRPFKIQKQFVEDIRAQNLHDAVSTLGKALLVCHAPLDETVGIENAGEIFMAAKHPKSFVSLDDADHLLTRHEDAIYVAGMIATWAERYIKDDEIKTYKTPKAKENMVIVAETGVNKFGNMVVTGSGHIMAADEPVDMGGSDTGPAPHDFLLAALGACKSMTMRMYADRKGYKLDRTDVRLSIEDVTAAHEGAPGKVNQISTEIRITGDLSDEERDKVFGIAARCPIHQVLTGEIKIDAELK